MNKQTLSIALALAATAAFSQEQTVYTIQNHWLQKHLYDADGKAMYGDYKEGDPAFSWTLDTIDGYRRLKNVKSSRYVAPGADGAAILGDGAGEAAQWTVEIVDGEWLGFRNRANKNLLTLEGQKGFATVDLDRQLGPNDFWSCHWKLDRIAGPAAEKFMPGGLVSVLSPEPGAVVKDSVKIELAAPGFLKLEARSWLPDGRFGKNTLLHECALDADGRAAFSLPLANLPQGPVMVTLTASKGDTKNNHFLQLFNESGKPWERTGAKNNPVPPAARDMKLVFTDDFDGPLSISADGKGARYASHKPGGGDFSNWNLAPFKEPDGTDTPFSQRGTWMRLRTDTNKKAAGLISSVNADGEGVTATVPCYFECRFIAHSAPGTWPAFWVMTTGVAKGLHVPADELDVIEAYGGEGPRRPNAPGYMIASHTWNQDDYKKPDGYGFYGPIHMRGLPGGGGASWYETPHTYGVLVGEEFTVYYCDDIEVARHRTTPVSKAEPLFFFVNNAVSSDWPADLSQYNGVADMYVDFARVYQGVKK